jgi:hypothetical protein
MMHHGPVYLMTTAQIRQMNADPDWVSVNNFGRVSDQHTPSLDRGPVPSTDAPEQSGTRGTNV